MCYTSFYHILKCCKLLVHILLCQLGYSLICLKLVHRKCMFLPMITILSCVIHYLLCSVYRLEDVEGRFKETVTEFDKSRGLSRKTKTEFERVKDER